MVCRADDSDELKLDLEDEEFVRLRFIQDSWTPKQERERNTSLKWYYSYRTRGVQRGLPVDTPEVHIESGRGDRHLSYGGENDDLADNEWWGQEHG